MKYILYYIYYVFIYIYNKKIYKFIIYLYLHRAHSPIWQYKLSCALYVSRRVYRSSIRDFLN